MSSITRFKDENKPEPSFRFEQVGSDPDVCYRVDWDERGHPTPRDFHRVNMLEVKLVVGMTGWGGEVQEMAEAAHDAIAELAEAMCDARGLNDEQRQQVLLGNLDGLPEVTRDV